ncbi:MAG TPA: hypothetical protein VGL89_00575 [Candidatus Koribacter sp.]|jgi:hypothetical protein
MIFPRRPVRNLLLASLLLPFLAAAQTKPEPQIPPTKPVPRELQSLIDATASVPPEFGADILLRIVESNPPLDAATKLKLIRNAFELAAGAQEPIKRKHAFAISSDTTVGFRNLSFFINLDGLTLQSRAVDDALTLAPRTARKLFEQLQPPDMPPLSCDEPLAYDPSAYYQTLTGIVRNTFTPKEIKEGHRNAYISSFVGSLQSHAQVAPVAQFLVAADLTPEELSDATTLFAAALQQLHGDNRSFSAVTSEANYAELEAFPKLVARLHKTGIPTPPLLRSVRVYLISNLSGVRCAESVRSKEGQLPLPASFFNETFAADLPPAQLRPIEANELSTAQVAPKIVMHGFWQTPESKQLLEDVGKLGAAIFSDPTHQAVRSTAEWQDKLQNFLIALDAWQGTGESEDDIFNEKLELYQAALDVTGPLPERSKVLDNFIDFLEQTRFQDRNRVQWFWAAKMVLDGRYSKENRPEILRAFRDSRDPTLSIYARFELWKSQNSPEAKKP